MAYSAGHGKSLQFIFCDGSQTEKYGGSDDSRVVELVSLTRVEGQMVRASVISSKHGVSGLHFTYSDEHRVEIELGDGDPGQRNVSEV